MRDNENYFRYKRNQQLEYRRINYLRQSSEFNEIYPNMENFQNENYENNLLNQSSSSNEEEENRNVEDEDSEESIQINSNNNTIIDNLPVNELDDVNNLEDSKKSCIICMDNFKKGDNIISLPCIHIFHSMCIKRWLSKKNTCPICKYAITINRDD